MMEPEKRRRKRSSERSAVRVSDGTGTRWYSMAERTPGQARRMKNVSPSVLVARPASPTAPRRAADASAPRGSLWGGRVVTLRRLWSRLSPVEREDYRAVKCRTWTGRLWLLAFDAPPNDHTHDAARVLIHRAEAEARAVELARSKAAVAEAARLYVEQQARARAESALFMERAADSRAAYLDSLPPRWGPVRAAPSHDRPAARWTPPTVVSEAPEPLPSPPVNSEPNSRGHLATVVAGPPRGGRLLLSPSEGLNGGFSQGFSQVSHTLSHTPDGPLPGGRPAAYQFDLARARELRSRGLGYGAIARSLGLPPRARWVVRNRLKEAAVEASGATPVRGP